MAVIYMYGRIVEFGHPRPNPLVRAVFEFHPPDRKSSPLPHNHLARQPTLFSLL